MQAVMQPVTLPELERVPQRQATASDGGSDGGGGAGAVGFDIADFLRGGSTLPKPPGVLLPIEKARRVASLVCLLEQFHELRDTLRAGDGDTYRDGGLLLAAHEPVCALLRRGRRCTCVLSGIAELERLLEWMRLEQPRLRFHVVAFFVDVERRGRWERRRTGPKRLRRLSPFVHRRVLVRDPRAEKHLAVEGVGWLAERWDLRDARNELVNPWLLGMGFDKAEFARLTSVHSPLLRSAAG